MVEDPADADADADVTLGDQGSGGGRDQHWLTGALALETGGGWSLLVGLDAPLRSAGPGYGPRLPPWNLLCAVGYGLFAGRPEVVTRTVTVERTVAPAPRQGQVVGWVRAAGGTAIAGATVEVVGVPRARVISDADGGFRTPLLAPGPLLLQVSAAAFRPRRLPVTIVAGRDAESPVTLEALGATVEAHLSDEQGLPVPGRIRLTDEATEQATVTAQVTATAAAGADLEGRLQLFLAPGPHRLWIEADGFLTQVVALEISDGAAVPVAIRLRPRPPVPSVLIGDGRLTLAGPMELGGAGADAALPPTTQALLDEVADLLLTRAPEAPRLRVEVLVRGATGDREALRLGEERAATVVTYLVDRGVPERRLVGVGLTTGLAAAGRRTSPAVSLRILD
jgi:hypothetical protein